MIASSLIAGVLLKAGVSIAGRPARCTSEGRKAPAPQAMVSAASITVPGSPSPATASAASTR